MLNGLSEHLLVSVHVSSRWSFDQDNSTYSFYLYSVIVEALKVDSLQRLCSSLEPMLRRVVRTKQVYTKRKYCSHIFMELLNVYWNFVFLSVDCNFVRLACRLVKKWSVPWENLVLLQSLGGMASNQQWSRHINFLVKSQHVTLYLFSPCKDSPKCQCGALSVLWYVPDMDMPLVWYVSGGADYFWNIDAHWFMATLCQTRKLIIQCRSMRVAKL